LYILNCSVTLSRSLYRNLYILNLLVQIYSCPAASFHTRRLYICNWISPSSRNKQKFCSREWSHRQCNENQQRSSPVISQILIHYAKASAPPFHRIAIPFHLTYSEPRKRKRGTESTPREAVGCEYAGCIQWICIDKERPRSRE
jgi:hypothetical protein